jgi:hypothetical protein
MTYRDDRESLMASLMAITKERDEARRDASTARERLDGAMAEIALARSSRRGERVRDVGRVLGIVGGGGFAVALGIGLVVAGVRSCEARLPDYVRGVVTDRYHYDEYTTQQCTTTGTVTTCTPINHPERWEVRVAHDGHERLDDVTEEEYDRTTIGSER